MPYRVERDKNGGGIITYFREDISSKILTQNLMENVEGIFPEMS